MKAPKHPTVCLSAYCGEVNCQGCEYKYLMDKYEAEMKAWRAAQ